MGEKAFLKRGQRDWLQRAFKLIYLLKNFDQIHEHAFSLKLLGWRKVDLGTMKNK